MEFRRTRADVKSATIVELPRGATSTESLLGDNREVMRHSNGAVHAALVESSGDRPRIAIFGAREFGRAMERLAGPISSDNSLGDSAPATDSNQNGAYVAYVEAGAEGAAGYVVHLPDPFGDPSDRRVHGPLTPAGGKATNSFLQASRAFNTVVYGWRDQASGDLFVGVSVDGLQFEPAQALTTDGNVVRGPATGVHGDYVIYVYETTNPRFAPLDARKTDGAYFAWSESGDGGKSWSEPIPLFPDNLPRATGFTLSDDNDLVRSEVVALPVAPAWDNSLQLLAWANVEDAYDSRVFALAMVSALTDSNGAEWTGSGNSIGLLASKRIAVGGDWEFVVTNRDMFRRAGLSEAYAGRTGTQYKYSALPGTPVRVVSYVDRAPKDSALEDQLAILVSTNKGASFDYESTFGAGSLRLDPDAELIISNSACCFADENGEVWQDLLIGDSRRPSSVRHATVPIGLNATGLDPTSSW